MASVPKVKSLALIVRDWVAIAVDSCDTTTVNDSANSAFESSVVVTVNVADVSPAFIVTVPEETEKSESSFAFVTDHSKVVSVSPAVPAVTV